MFNIIKGHTDVSDQYGQLHQPNPMWFQFAQRNKKDLTLLSAKMSCRDFFNDAVSAYHGFTVGESYGYNAEQIKFNRYGLYVYYTGIYNPEQFILNIEQAINPRLKQDTGSEIKCQVQEYTNGQKLGSVVVRLPTAVLKSVWRMSLVTQLIRNCNWNISYDSWESLFTNWPDREKQYTIQTYNLCQKIGFVSPYAGWWYSNVSYNSSIPGLDHRQHIRSIRGMGILYITNRAQQDGTYNRLMGA